MVRNEYGEQQAITWWKLVIVTDELKMKIYNIYISYILDFQGSSNVGAVCIMFVNVENQFNYHWKGCGGTVV